MWEGNVRIVLRPFQQKKGKEREAIYSQSLKVVGKKGEWYVNRVSQPPGGGGGNHWPSRATARRRKRKEDPAMKNPMKKTQNHYYP